MVLILGTTSSGLSPDVKPRKVTEKISFSEAKTKAEKCCCNENFGLEIDMDTVANMGSSAMNPVGFSIAETRNFVSHFSKNKNCSYIHLAEGAPNRELFPNQVGKLLGYLVCDVLKNQYLNSSK